MVAGWVDTDRGAFNRYKSVWLLSTTQQLITLELVAGKQRSPIQPDRQTHTRTHALIRPHTCTYVETPTRKNETFTRHRCTYVPILTPADIENHFVKQLFSVDKHIFCKYAHTLQLVYRPGCLIKAKIMYFTLITHFPVCHLENRGQTTFPRPPPPP